MGLQDLGRQDLGRQDFGPQDFVATLDKSKVVALDFRTAEFRQNGHRLVAGWARQPPFYVLGDGTAGN